MRPQQCDGDRDEIEALPTDGMDVEEVRDADTARLFVLEWRRRVRRESGKLPATPGRMWLPRSMIGA